MQNLRRNWLRLDPTFESLKICTLIVSLWPRYIMFELKKYRRVIPQDAAEWCKEKLILKNAIECDAIDLKQLFEGTLKV